MSATAGWPLPRLVSALARAGWAELDGRANQGVRSVLRALVDLLPHGSATGMATANQVADATGLSDRWTRECLSVMEDAGLLTWTRGGISEGRPTAGFFRISKRALADLVNRARGALTGRLQRRADETATRVRETLRNASTVRKNREIAYRQKQRRARSDEAVRRPAPNAGSQPALSSTPSPYREVTGTADAARCSTLTGSIAGKRREPSSRWLDVLRKRAEAGRMTQ